MGGQPQVMRLLAVAIALWFASPVAAPPAAAEFRLPIPGLFTKEKFVKPKRYVRPTPPSRNPTRVTARLSARAISPPQAKDSEVIAAVGARSSASVSLALPRAPKRPDKAVERAKDDIAAEVAAATGATADAVHETDSDELATDVAGDAPKTTAAAEPSRDNSEENEESSSENATTTTADLKATEREPTESVDSESAGNKPNDAADQSDEASVPAETAETDTHDVKASAASATTATLPDHDASVVLNVTPPPEDLSVAEAEEPAPPPAHPVVAQVREKLEDPGLRKIMATSDLQGLKAFYGEHEGSPLWVTDNGFTAKAQKLIAEIGKADEWGLKASSYDLPSAADWPAIPDAIARNELQLSVALLSYARDAQIGRLRPRRVSRLFDQHPSLRDPKIVIKEIAAADKPSAYLLSLHPQHYQFKRLRIALAKARENAELTGRDPRTDRDVQLITINMERWRWLPRSLGNYHVWANVPEFNVRVKKGRQTIYKEKTIVGQYKYATPFFSAKMRNIVFHPNWTVPPTIVKEDIAPKLQRGGGGGFFGASKEAILQRYGLKASFKGERVNADTVDWNNVNVHTYTFTQDPGPANVLGKFKFNFPNKHAIYMHDTVQPELFAQTNRTLSHGCIRVHQPDRFATLLLSQDKGWATGQVQDLVAKNETKVISLNRHVPVHLTYFTAVVDEYGTLNRLGDIYGIDNIMAQKLFSNPASFGAPESAPFSELGNSPTRVSDTPTGVRETPTQSRRRNSTVLINPLSGLFGN